MIIDTHAHLVPQPMLDALTREIGRFPNVELLHEGDSWRLGFAGRTPTRPVMPLLRDCDKRLGWMEGCGIDVQLIGGWLDAFGYELPPDEGLAWSRLMNEQLRKQMSASDRLVPLATVPLQSGRLAAQALEEALKAGFAGAMIGTQPKGDSGCLDDPDLDPFWEAASGLGASLFLHPMYGCGDPRLEQFGLRNAVGRGNDTSTAVARLLFTGHFTRYPGMRMVLSHGGGSIPFLLGRLRRNKAIAPDLADPLEGFRTLYFDSVLFDPAALRFLHNCCGGGRIVLGSDYPFPIGDPDPVRVVREAAFDDADTARILGGTAAELFGIDAVETA